MTLRTVVGEGVFLHSKEQCEPEGMRSYTDGRDGGRYLRGPQRISRLRGPPIGGRVYGRGGRTRGREGVVRWTETSVRRVRGLQDCGKPCNRYVREGGGLRVLTLK